MPLGSNVGANISELYHAEREGRASVAHRSRKQKIAIAFAAARKAKRKRK